MTTAPTTATSKKQFDYDNFGFMDGIPGEPIYKSAEMCYLCTKCKHWQFFTLSDYHLPFTNKRKRKYDTIEILNLFFLPFL